MKSIAIPEADLVTTDLEPSETMDKTDETRFGPKASNLGVIASVRGDDTEARSYFEAGLADAARDGAGPKVDARPQRLEQIRRARQAGG